MPYLLLAALIVLPFFGPGPNTVRLLFVTFVWVTVSIAWNILGGFGGQVSFGFAVFYGLGAYTAALAVNSGLHTVLALLLAALPAGCTARAPFRKKFPRGPHSPLRRARISTATHSTSGCSCGRGGSSPRVQPKRFPQVLGEAMEGGYIPGPRPFVSTRAISTTGGYPLEGYAPELTMPKGAQLIDGPIEARKAAREQLDNGADWIKVYMTHRSWVGKSGELVSQPTLTLEEFKAIVDETHGWGKKVACHAYSGIGLQRALDGGCDSIEHGLALSDAQVAQMVKQGTWYCPTIAVYYTDWGPPDTPAGQRDRLRVSVHEESFRKAMKAGVKIVFGTDMGGIPWTQPIAQEFPRMVDLGMSPMEAIRSATSRAAEMLDSSGQIGLITPGAYADVIAVPGDPLRDVKELGNVQFVMKDGKVFKDEVHRK